jgi:hypothetical protein
MLVANRGIEPYPGGSCLQIPGFCSHLPSLPRVEMAWQGFPRPGPTLQWQHRSLLIRSDLCFPNGWPGPRRDSTAAQSPREAAGHCTADDARQPGGRVPGHSSHRFRPLPRRSSLLSHPHVSFSLHRPKPRACRVPDRSQISSGNWIVLPFLLPPGIRQRRRRNVLDQQFCFPSSCGRLPGSLDERRPQPHSTRAVPKIGWLLCRILRVTTGQYRAPAAGNLRRRTFPSRSACRDEIW